jgi:hypothetical protein
VPVETVAVDTPESTLTVVEPEVTAVTIFAFVAVADTDVLADRPVIAILTAWAEVTSLLDGTGIAIAVADVVPAVTAGSPDTVSAVVAALAGPATSMVPTRATAEAIAISGFFNEVMFLFSFY